MWQHDITGDMTTDGEEVGTEERPSMLKQEGSPSQLQGLVKVPVL